MICPLFSAITRFNYLYIESMAWPGQGIGIVRLPLQKGPSKVNWNTSQSAGTLTFSFGPLPSPRNSNLSGYKENILFALPSETML